VQWIGIFGFYLGAAVVMTFPLALHLDSRLLGHAFSDTTEYLRHSWWMAELLRGQIALDAPLLLYPDGLDPALLWSIPLQSLPTALLSFILPLPAAFNLAALLTLALNGLAMHALARTLTISGAGALIAGLVFMLFPAFQGQLALGHVGLVTLYPAPLLLAALIRLARAPHMRDLALAAVWMMMVGWGSALLWLYLLLPTVGVWLAILIGRRDWRALRWTLAALALGAALALPFVLLGLRSASVSGGGLSVFFSATPLNIIAPSFSHPLWGSLGLAYPRRVLGIDPFEGAAYIGVIAGALALIGIIRRREARWWLAAATLAWLLSWGALFKLEETAPVGLVIDGYPTHVALPWALLERLPILSISRTPVRFSFAIGLALAVMAGYGADSLLNAKAQKRKDTPLRVFASLRWVILAGLIAFDYQTFFPMPTAPAAIPPIMAALAERDDIRAVFNVPWEHPLTDKEGLYFQTAHRLPMIAGHLARNTPLNPAKGWLLQETLDPALLDAVGADLIIVHREWDYAGGGLEARLRERFGAPLFADARVAVFEPPDPTQPLAPLNRVHRYDDATWLFFYLPEGGAFTLVGTARTDGARGALARLDDQPIWRGQLSDGDALALPLPPLDAGFHFLSVTLDPPCVTPPHEALRCATLRIEGMELR
jgi:hypothetical protein